MCVRVHSYKYNSDKQLLKCFVFELKEISAVEEALVSYKRNNRCLIHLHRKENACRYVTRPCCIN
jgi:hypothetical protein